MRILLQIFRAPLHHPKQKLLEVESKYFLPPDSQSRRLEISGVTWVITIATIASDGGGVALELRTDEIGGGFGDAPCCNELGKDKLRN